MLRRTWLPALLAFSLASPDRRRLPADDTLLLRMPTVSAGAIAFVYAGDLWIVPRTGGEARQLTSAPGLETNPRFSPDGRWIAFSANYSGNADVYVVPAEGGQPRRLTWHPEPDLVQGWTPDGKRVVFASSRGFIEDFNRLYSVPLEGGLEEPLPMPTGERLSYGPDAARIAYVPVRRTWHEQTWRRYRGGQQPWIWLFDVRTREVEAVPHDTAGEDWPMWIGDVVYFLSDRDGTMNLYGYDLRTRQSRQLTRHTDFDIKSASAGAGVIVYEQGGRVNLFDPAKGTSEPVHVHVDPDLPSTRPHWASAVPYIQHAALSPTGARAVIEARGDVFTVPAKKGDVRNLTATPGVAERDPAWSPDGQRIAYFSDAGGEYHLVLRDQSGLTPETAIPLADPSFFYSPVWSPDSKRLAYTDKRLHLWTIDVDKRQPVLVDTDLFDQPERSINPAWSPDGKWLAYVKRLQNHLRAVFVYELATGKSHQVTDGRSDAVWPVFSLDGKYLYFTASTNYGLNTGWLDLTSFERPVRRSLYVAVLDRTAASPFAPESDEEPAKAAGKPAPKDTTKKTDSLPTVKIDFTGLDQRILAVPVPDRDYSQLGAAAEGRLFYLESVPNQPGFLLHRYDLKERKAEDFLTGVTGYEVSADGKKLGYAAPGNVYGIVATDGKAAVGDGKLDLTGLQSYADPRAEWAQMFDEFWRIERDFFYDPATHGANWPAIKQKYKPFLAHVGHRSDLTYLIQQMMAEIVVGHMFAGGGDEGTLDTVKVGLLGADFTVENGYYRFSRIYGGLNWNPDLRAPLTEPGVTVSGGDYLLAVNGRPLLAATNLYSAFENTAGRQTVLLVNGRPTPDGARTVTVVPVENETPLRNRAWVEGNRRLVDSLSGGRVAYVWLPDTYSGGYAYFNRYYFSQLDRQAVVVDERFNHGGDVADYVLDLLNRPVLAYVATREGRVIPSPLASIYGPKVMVINEYAGSGGDALPLYFRRRGLGRLVGRRTWGGLVGIWDYPLLVDGGYVTAPRGGLFSPSGEWDAENTGVPPDIEVEMTPKLVLQGRDPQLEKAVEVVLEELRRNPPPSRDRAHPPFPTRGRAPSP